MIDTNTIPNENIIHKLTVIITTDGNYIYDIQTPTKRGTFTTMSALIGYLKVVESEMVERLKMDKNTIRFSKENQF